MRNMQEDVLRFDFCVEIFGFFFGRMVECDFVVHWRAFIHSLEMGNEIRSTPN